MATYVLMTKLTPRRSRGRRAGERPGTTGRRRSTRSARAPVDRPLRAPRPVRLHGHLRSPGRGDGVPRLAPPARTGRSRPRAGPRSPTRTSSASPTPSKARRADGRRTPSREPGGRSGVRGGTPPGECGSWPPSRNHRSPRGTIPSRMTASASPARTRKSPRFRPRKKRTRPRIADISAMARERSVRRRNALERERRRRVVADAGRDGEREEQEGERGAVERETQRPSAPARRVCSADARTKADDGVEGNRGGQPRDEDEPAGFLGNGSRSGHSLSPSHDTAPRSLPALESRPGSRRSAVTGRPAPTTGRRFPDPAGGGGSDVRKPPDGMARLRYHSRRGDRSRILPHRLPRAATVDSPGVSSPA